MATKKEVMDIAAKMMPLMPDNGNGWYLRVWENLGYHFELRKGIVSVTKSGKEYHCFIYSAPNDTGGIGPCSAYGKTPKATIKKAVQQMRAYAIEQETFWNGIRQQLKDF